MKEVYLDYAASTPLDEGVLEKMRPFFTKKYANPSSIHKMGRDASLAIGEAREKVASFLSASPEEVIFTGSATQANNGAILGYLRGIKNPHIITTKIEHEAVLLPSKKIEEEGGEVTFLKVDKKGRIDLEELRESIKENTAMVSIMYASNEVGVIEPIEKVGEIIEEINKKRERKIVFHTDAVQAAGYLNCNVKDLKVDLLTLSGHKIYGPKGVGVLFKKEGLNLSPLFFGGGQEKGISPGTYNTPLIVGMGEAVSLLKNKKGKETEKLRDYLIEGVLKIEGASLNGPMEKRLPNNANFSFKGVEGESLVLGLDSKGVAVSTGSACSSHSLKPSHVLMAMGLSREEAHSSLRVSIGRMTTKEEIDYFLEVLPGTIKRLREISGK